MYLYIYQSLSSIYLSVCLSIYLSIDLSIYLPIKVHKPLRLPRESTSEHPKVVRTRPFFCTFDIEM